MMEEFIDFVIDVFGNVLKKFQINAFIILIIGIISSFLFIPEIFLKYAPNLFLQDIIAIKVFICLLSFIFIKVFMLTIKRIKINFNTAKLLFMNLLKPFFLGIIFMIIFGILIFISCAPIIFPSLTEKFVIAFFSAAVAAGILVLALLPNAVISLFFAYEGRTFREALIEANRLIEHRRSKMYFLMIFLALCILVLNLTHFGMIIAFPLIVMAMDQARESLIAVEKEKDNAKTEQINKSYYHYSPKVDYAKDYFEYNEYDKIRNKKDLIAAEQKESVPLQKNSAETNLDSSKISVPESEKDISSKITSSLGYNVTGSTVEEDKEIVLSDFIDLEAYSKEKAQKEEIEDIDGKEHEISIEFEPYKKHEEEKKEKKSGKEYIDGFGAIEKKPVQKPYDIKEKNKRSIDAKTYIENYGLVKRKK
ncbi:MAG: hypothetical protein LBD46_01150 [Endomicrobium sp.]|jgi:phosphoglycerol transferase MdoB-like AlkP superfamily enzyme|nr:hypothetical protein [Endomicrobium sp.]